MMTRVFASVILVVSTAPSRRGKPASIRRRSRLRFPVAETKNQTFMQ